MKRSKRENARANSTVKDQMRDDFLDFGQLKTFLRVVDEKSVVRAARGLEVSQPSVSQQIRRLELKLGRTLFVRRGKTLRLTNDGEALVVFARALFAVAGRVRDYFMQPDLSGSLRIGLNEDLARTALPSVLHLFSRAHPNFHLDVRCSTDGQQLFKQIDEGHRDIVVARRSAGRPRSTIVWEQPLHWIGRRHDRGPIKPPIPLVVPPSPSECREHTLAALNAANIDWQIRFESESLTGLEAAVKAGVGVCVAVAALASGDICVLGPEFGLPDAPSAVYALECRPKAYEVPGLEAFEALLRTTIPLLATPSLMASGQT